MTLRNRRPIAARSLGWIRALAARLADSAVTPNQISQASMLFALVACVTFWTASEVGTTLRVPLLLLAALAVQGRLLCNLLDGMVAVEGGKSSATGPFWNEAPDRIADVLILWGLGLAAGMPIVGLLAGAAAVGTAYLRELGRSEGMAPDFGGPLAKPQRMAVATGAPVLAALGLIFGAVPLADLILATGIWVILAGTAATVVLRSRRLVMHLSRRG